MKKSVVLAGVICAAFSVQALAQEYTEFPGPILYQHVQHSWLSGDAVRITPYPCPFPVRIYTTPPQPPFYNVPPYAVVSPY